MGVRISTEAKNEALRAALGNCDGGKCRFYTGSAPAEPTDAATGTLLVEFTPLSSPCSSESSGTATLENLAAVNASVTGTPGYMRLTKSDNTGVADFDVDVGREFTANVNDTLTSVGHGLSDGDAVVCTSTGALPAGLGAQLLTRYVRDATSDTFKLASSAGGAALDVTDTGSGVHRVFRAEHIRVNAGFVAGEPVDPGTITLSL